MGKSAQMPLHVWLPDSMEGPTPISALIHAATMVTAGIFMVARMSPLFELSQTALNLVLFIGATTAFWTGLIGIVQNDIKRVVAYSTLSQLGYMTVALGVSAYSAAVYHLMTHAFFKALLFLGAGSVIIAMHHEQDMRRMGGLRKYMPITFITMWIGTLALTGMPFLSGFYSKDTIIEAAAEHAHEAHSWVATYGYWAVLLGVFVTSFYSFRLLYMTFHGRERFRDPAPEGENNVGHEEAEEFEHAHDAHDLAGDPVGGLCRGGRFLLPARDPRDVLRGSRRRRRGGARRQPPARGFRRQRTGAAGSGHLRRSLVPLVPGGFRGLIPDTNT